MTDDTTLLCLATGCGREQAPGVRLCPRHREDVGQWLAQVGDMFAALDATPSLQGREPDTGGSGGLAAHRSVGSMDVMTLRDRRSQARREDDPDGNAGRGVLEVLAYWAGAVRVTQKILPARRQLPPVRVTGGPEGPVCATWCPHDTCRHGTLRGTAPVPTTVAGERLLLARHLDWIVAQDAAGRFCDEIRAVWVLLRSANGEGDGKRTVLCPACGVPARWTDGAIGCGACGTTTAGLGVLRRPVAA